MDWSTLVSHRYWQATGKGSVARRSGLHRSRALPLAAPRHRILTTEQKTDTPLSARHLPEHLFFSQKTVREFWLSGQIKRAALQPPLFGSLIKKATRLFDLDPVVHVVNPHLIILR